MYTYTDILLFIFQSVKLIKEWKMHIICTVNQDRAGTDILENMKSDKALLERDWAMKFLPLQYRYLYSPQIKFGRLFGNHPVHPSVYPSIYLVQAITSFYLDGFG